MSRKKTEINPIRAERVKTLIEREGIKQTAFAEKIHMTQQNVSRIITGKNALTEETARDIVEAFPDYRISWLLGYDDTMTWDQWKSSTTNEQHFDEIRKMIEEVTYAMADAFLYAGERLKEALKNCDVA